jgi:hypothetical protein
MDTTKKISSGLSLACLVLSVSTSGLLGLTQAAVAKPPDWAPAWGYRENQDFERQGQGRPANMFLPAGTLFPVRSQQSGWILMRRNEVMPLNLFLDQDVQFYNSRRSIPRGSRIVGELRPSEGWTRYFSRYIVLPNGSRYPLDARSRLLRGNRQYNFGREDRFNFSDSARVLLGSMILGVPASDLGLSLGRNRMSERYPDIVAIDPEQDLDLRLVSDAYVRY